MKVWTSLSHGHNVDWKPQVLVWNRDVRKVDNVEGAEGGLAVIFKGLLKVKGWLSNRSVLPPVCPLSPPHLRIMYFSLTHPCWQTVSPNFHQVYAYKQATALINSTSTPDLNHSHSNQSRRGALSSNTVKKTVFLWGSQSPECHLSNKRIG